MKKNELISSITILVVAWCLLLMVCIQEFAYGNTFSGWALIAILLATASGAIYLLNPHK